MAFPYEGIDGNGTFLGHDEGIDLDFLNGFEVREDVGLNRIDSGDDLIEVRSRLIAISH
jgi:hypothetical protein